MAPRFNFGPHDGPGDELTSRVDGFTVTARIEHDETHPPPWEAEDGHGPVSDWRSGRYSEHGHAHKRAGELVLSRDGSSARFYDYAAACRTALAEGWGTHDGKRSGETPRQYAARAALEDFRRLKAWCDDEWTWAGVMLTVERAEVELGHASLWGIESDAGRYFGEVARDLLPEALDAARAKLAELQAA